MSRRKTPHGGPSRFLAGWRASNPEIRKAVEAGRIAEARRIRNSNRNTTSFEEAVAAGDWVEALSFRAGHRWGAIAAGWLREYKFTRDELRDLACALWLGAEPVPVGFGLSADDWVAIWSATGFYSNTERRRPTHPLVVYRGGIAALGPFGMSWTPNRKLARVFALARSGSEEGAVYQLEVSPRDVLAILEPECPTKETIEQMKRIGEFVEVIVHPDTTLAARRIESTRPTQRSPQLRRRTLGEAFEQEVRAMTGRTAPATQLLPGFHSVLPFRT